MNRLPHNHPKNKVYRRNLRRRETKAEALLWQILRNRQVAGLRFKRQHGIGPFIVDFYCHQIRLIIEVDGGYHDLPKQKSYDQWREAFLDRAGYRMLRFRNEEVLEQPEWVVGMIYHVAVAGGE